MVSPTSRLSQRMSGFSLLVRVASTIVALTASVLLGLFTLVPPSGALAGPEYSAIRGADRYETAVEVSRRGFAPGVDAVVIATGQNYPDALTAAPLAAAYGGPVLLTRSDVFSDVTRDEVARLQPGTIFAVGLGGEVLAQIRAAFPDMASAGGIVLLAGSDRYGTARLVAEQIGSRLGAVPGVVIAPGDSFADALSVGPLAALKGWPILLTPAQGPLPDATMQALVSLAPANGLAVGTYVNPGLSWLTMTRLVGSDRYETCAKVAEYAAGEGLSYQHVGVVTGEDYPDALVAGSYLARDAAILLLVQARGAPLSISTLLLDRSEEIGQVDFVGLPATAAQHVKLLLTATDLPDGFGFSTLTRGSNGGEVLWLEQRLTDLTYRPGPIDGVFDERTYQAVLAFQKWEGLSRDGAVGPQVWARIIGAMQPWPSTSGTGEWIEVNKAKQVLLYVENGRVLRTLPVSTGSPAVGIVTPSRTFTIYAKSNKWDGPRYKPLYLRNILAIHGYPSVPPWPASHGCIRVPLWDMDEFFPLIPVGTKVHVY